ncbi:MAG: CHAT domain-containing protein [Saprospiraceae bacterium]
MDTLLLAFSNHRTQPLQTLVDEYISIDRTLAPRLLKQHFLAKSLSHATLDDIAYYLTLFRDSLSLFLYSGHAGRDRLLTEDGDSRAAGIAHLLGQCPHLKVVILNGCSTAGQVVDLHKVGVPVVIATSAPVNDEAATRFSSRLFQALETGLTIGESFEQGIGETLARQEIRVHRGFDLSGYDPDESLWGIFPNPAKQDEHGWKLPSRSVQQVKGDAKPNEHLLETLYETFKDANEHLIQFHADDVALDERTDEIVNAILRAIPAPISEHLRKLVMPSLPGTPNPIGEPSPERLAQLAQTYQISMDFLVFVLLAQLWDASLSHPEDADRSFDQFPELELYLSLSAEERRSFDYFSVLRRLGEALEIPFVEEYAHLRESFFNDEKVKNACFFLDNLGRLRGSASMADMPELCARAEKELASVFEKLGFLGKYILATVRNINVQKYRHTPEAQFEHMVVKWHGTLGYYDKEFRRQSDFMDNRSVVLLRVGDGKSGKFLNLSPFILDENTFEKVPDTSLSKLYFFSFRERGEDGSVHLVYKFVNDPEGDVIRLDDEEFLDKKKVSKFALAMEQFSVFYDTVCLNQKASRS